MLVCGAASDLARSSRLDDDVLIRCEEFAERGCIVYATARKLASMEAFTHERIRKLTLDVTSDDDVQDVIDKIVAAEGHIDIVVNNAGVICVGECLSIHIGSVTLNNSPRPCGRYSSRAGQEDLRRKRFWCSKDSARRCPSYGEARERCHRQRGVHCRRYVRYLPSLPPRSCPDVFFPSSSFYSYSICATKIAYMSENAARRLGMGYTALQRRLFTRSQRFSRWSASR